MARRIVLRWASVRVRLPSGADGDPPPVDFIAPEVAHCQNETNEGADDQKPDADVEQYAAD